MARCALPTQLSFLLQRARRQQAWAQDGAGGRRRVSDFMFAKEALFARLTLREDEYALYAQLHERLLAPQTGPDLIICLQAPPAVLLGRIARRGIAMERHIGADDLQRLCDACARYFRGDPGVPVVAVATQDFNPAERDADFAQLCQRLAAVSGRPGPPRPLPPPA